MVIVSIKYNNSFKNPLCVAHSESSVDIIIIIVILYFNCDYWPCNCTLCKALREVLPGIKKHEACYLTLNISSCIMARKYVQTSTGEDTHKR